MTIRYWEIVERRWPGTWKCNKGFSPLQKEEEEKKKGMVRNKYEDNGTAKRNVV